MYTTHCQGVYVYMKNGCAMTTNNNKNWKWNDWNYFWCMSWLRFYANICCFYWFLSVRATFLATIYIVIVKRSEMNAIKCVSFIVEHLPTLICSSLSRAIKQKWGFRTASDFLSFLWWSCTQHFNSTNQSKQKEEKTKNKNCQRSRRCSQVDTKTEKFHQMDEVKWRGKNGKITQFVSSNNAL